MQLPELARSLRALGAVHGAAAESAHAAVFGPLLEARARATSGGLEAAVEAFRGHALGARITARAADVARAGELDAARARARVARAKEAVEALRRELHVLDTLTPAGAVNRLPTMSPSPLTWMEQLARVFRAADDACGALTLVLGAPAEPAARGWLGRFGRR